MVSRSGRSITYALVLAALVLLGFALRVYDLDGQSLWYDEAVTAQVAQQGIADLARWTADDIQPPLYYAVVAGWTQAAGRSEAALRLPSVFFGVSMIVLAFALGRRLFGPAAGLLAALLAAVQPLWVYYSQEARMYTLLTALGMLAGYALLRVLAAPPGSTGHLKTRLWWWLALAAASIALLYTHYFAAFLLLAYAVYFLTVVLVHRGPQTARLLGEGVVVAALVALAYLPWLPNAVRRFGVDSSYWQGALKLNEALRHIAISFTAGETVLENQAIVLAWVVGAIAVLCLAALLVGTVSRSNSPQRRGDFSEDQRSRRSPSMVHRSSVLFVLLYLIVPVVAILALSFSTPKFNPRYLMLASPGLTLLLAGGLALPFSRARTVFSQPLARVAAGTGLAIVLLISVYALRNWYSDPAFTKDDWRGAAAYVRSQIQPDEAVVLVSGHAAPAWRYYAPDLAPLRLPELEILDVNAVLDGASAAGVLSQELSGKSGAWLVQWQEEVVDPTGVTEYLLEQAGAEQPQPASFWGLDQVRHFRFEPGTVLPDSLTPDAPLNVDFGGQVLLLGSSQPTCQPTADHLPCPVYLFLQAQTPLDADLKLSAQLIDGYGSVWSPALEQRLSAYEYPTFRWQPGNVVLSRLDVIPFPGTPPGDYSLRLGVYALAEDGVTTQPVDRLDSAGAPAGRWTQVPVQVQELTPASLADQIDPPVAAAPNIQLVQARGGATAVQAGGLLAVDLWWQPSGEPPADYEIRWEWRDEAGQTRASGMKPAAGESYPTSLWQMGAPVHSQVVVPAPSDAAPGQWTLHLGMSAAGHPDRFLGESHALDVGITASERTFEAPPVEFPVNAPVGDQITLVGASTVTGTVSPGSELPVTVVWRAGGPAAASYTAFVHLIDAAGRVVAQDDHLPRQGNRPTNGWAPGEVIVDQHLLKLPANLSEGLYRLEVGMYDAGRPDLARPGEAAVLGGIEVR